MSGLKLDATGDLDFTDNKLSMTEGLDAVRQHLQEKLSLFLGEWFLNTDLGVPYYQDILIKNPSFPVIHEELKNQILDTPGVLELTQFDLSLDTKTRIAKISFKAECDDGPLDFTKNVKV